MLKKGAIINKKQKIILLSDGDGIQDDQDANPLEYDIDNSKFTIGDKLFMQSSNLAYKATDGKVKGETVNLGEDFNLINNWSIIGSDDSGEKTDDTPDSGFGAIAITQGDKIIISFEGSGSPTSEEAWYDWIKTDVAVVGLGLTSKQVYSAYKFINKVISENSGKII